MVAFLVIEVDRLQIINQRNAGTLAVEKHVDDFGTYHATLQVLLDEAADLLGRIFFHFVAVHLDVLVGFGYFVGRFVESVAFKIPQQVTCVDVGFGALFGDFACPEFALHGIRQ